MMLTVYIGVRAQDCNAIVLPMFGNDPAVMANTPDDKIAYWCYFSQASFYESDTVPAGVDVYNISQVREAHGTTYLSQDYVVDLTTLSYFAYNFTDFQHQYSKGNVTLCFSTPSSTHPYLVLRSIDDATRMAIEALDAYYIERY